MNSVFDGKVSEKKKTKGVQQTTPVCVVGVVVSANVASVATPTIGGII